MIGSEAMHLGERPVDWDHIAVCRSCNYLCPEERQHIEIIGVPVGYRRKPLEGRLILIGRLSISR